MNDDQIFEQAVQISDVSVRNRFIDKQCIGDSSKSEFVRRLVESHFSSGQFLERPAAGFQQPDCQTDWLDNSGTWNFEKAGDSIGPYTLVEEIGRGGMAVVFKARQHEPMRRQVAIKMIKPGLETGQFLSRMQFERQALAMMNHRGIASVFDAGISDLGRPYFVMELVEGRPLTEFCDANKLSHRQRIKLVIEVCDAVEHAHRHGIIHRDLKPSNILVSQDGQNPIPKIIDFGIAKTLTPEPGINDTLTVLGQIVGTPQYMSPEQAAIGRRSIDIRSDVYSLGAVLYELVTGEPPIKSDTIIDTLNRIANEDPVPPSKINSSIDRDLETICLCCLQKNPDRRYGTAGALAEDLARHLECKPINARPIGPLTRVWKWAHRSPAAACLAVVSTLAVLVLFGLWATFTFQLKTQRDEITRSAAQLEFRTYVAHVAAADSSIRVYDVQDTLQNLSNAPEKHRCFEWWYLLGRVDLSEMSIGSSEAAGEVPFTGGYRTVDYSPDGTWIVAGNAAGMVFFWNSDSRRITCHFDCGSPVQRLRVHPNGKQVAVGLGSGDAIILDVDLVPGELQSVRPATVRFSTEGKQLHALEYSPDGRFLVLACGTHPESGSVLVFRLDTAELVRTLQGHKNPVWSVAVSPDGRLIASGDNEIRIWDFESGDLVTLLPGHTNWVWDLAFHPDSNQLASCAVEQEVKIWDIASGEFETSLIGHTSFVNALEYSHDGKLLATVSEDRTIRFWETDNYSSTAVKWGHIGSIVDIAFGPQGKLATSGNNCVKTWNSQPEAASRLGFGHYHKILDLDISPDSKRMLASDDRGSLVEWNLTSKRRSRIAMDPPQQEKAIRSVTYSPTNGYAAWSSDDGNVYLFSFRNKQATTLSGHTAPVNSVAFSSDGASLYSASDDKTVLQWDGENRSSIVFCKSLLPIRKLLSSGDGRWLATADEQGISIWDAVSRERVAEIPRQIGKEAENFEMAFNPAGTQIAAPLPFGLTGIWSVPDGKEVANMGEHTQLVQSLAWSPDGKRIATASRDGTIKLWDSERFQVVLTLRGFSGYCETIAFSPDNLRLVGGMYDGSIRMWETLPPERR